MNGKARLSHAYATVSDLAAARAFYWGARHIWLRDPDGHLISIYSSSDADGK